MKKMNMLKFKPLRALFSWRYFPMVPQLVMLFVFLAIIAGGMAVGYHPRITNYLSRTNLANQMVWNYWWPVVIILSATLGRVWCMVCPVEIISSLASSFGLKRKVPGVIKSGWVITALYAFILFVAMRRWNVGLIPRRMAIYMIVLFIIAVAVGLIFRKRAFCSYMCPIGRIIALYSHLSILEWRADDPEVCRTCKTRDCVASRNHYNITGHSCTSNLYPAHIPDNRECLLCSHCMTACPYSNFRLSFRMPGEDFLGKMRVRVADMVLLLIIIGFVNNNPPSLIFILAPLLLALLVNWKRPVDALQAFMVLLIPMTAVAHALHSWRGLIYNSPYWEFHLVDPLGIRTATLLVDKVVELGPGVLAPALHWYGKMVNFLHGAVLLLSVIIISKGRVTERLSPVGKLALLVGVISYIASFSIRVKF